jgi:hypothetical protein
MFDPEQPGIPGLSTKEVAMRNSGRWVCVLGLVLLGSVASHGASEKDGKKDGEAPPKKPAAATKTATTPQSPYAAAAGKKAEAGATLSFSNDDLESMYGKPEPAAPAPTPAKAASKPTDGAKTDRAKTADPLAAMEDAKAREAERRQRVADATTALESARAEVARLEKQVLAIKNPFSARAELSDEEKAKRFEGQESASARLARTEKMLDEARQRLAEAERGLAEARSPAG